MKLDFVGITLHGLVSVAVFAIVYVAPLTAAPLAYALFMTYRELTREFRNPGLGIEHMTVNRWLEAGVCWTGVILAWSLA